MAGRKSKYTPENVQRILAALAGGATQKDAAAYIGVDEDTFCRWKNRYADFADNVQKAQSQARLGAIARILKAGTQGTWQADAWFLERSDPANWGRRDRLILEYGLSPDLINQLARAIAQSGDDVSATFNELIAEYAQHSGTGSESSGAPS